MQSKKHAFQASFKNAFPNQFLIKFLISFLFFLGANVGRAQVSLSFVVPSEMTVCGSSKQFQVTIANNSSGQLQQVKAQIVLPTGIQYVAGTVAGTGVSEFSISNLSSVTFSLPYILVGTSYTFTFSVRASYSALAAAQSGTVFKNTVNLTYTGGSKSAQTNAYNVLYPALTITSAPNASVYVGQTFTRAVTIVNGGFGELSSLTLTDQFNSSLLSLLSVDKGSLASGGVITFSGADFTSIGDGDALFENNETLIVTETITAIGCSSTQSTLTAKWGCDATLAESNKKYPATTITLYAPNLAFSATANFNTCFSSTGDEQILQITNSGTGPAKSPSITIAAGTSDLYTRVDASSITWQIGTGGTPTSLTPTTTTAASAHTCFGVTSPKAGFTVSLPDVAPGQVILLKWKTYTCATTACGSVNLIGWTYSASYTNMCNSQTYTASGTGRSVKKKNFSMFVENPADLYNGQTGEYIFTLTTATFDMPQGTDPHFLAEFDLPAGLEWSGDNADLTFKSGSTAWSPTSVTYNSATRRLTAKYPLPIPITLAYSSVRVKFTANCASGSAGLVNVGFALYYVMNGSCASPHKFSLTCYASPQTRLHCPGAACVGMGFESFSPKRWSKGAPDNNQDGIADASGTLDLTKIQLNRVMTKDTFETVFTGKIYTDATYPTWSYAFAKSQMPQGSSITALWATLSVFDASTGTTLTATLNAPSSNSNSGGIRTTTWNLSPATVGGSLTGFVYENGDILTLRAHYQLSGNIGASMTQINFTNEMYTATTSAGTTKFQCDTWSGNLTLVGYSFSNAGSEQYNVESCTKIISQNFRLFMGQSSVAAGMDLFPYEYRNWAIVKDLQVTMPPGYTYVSATMSQVRTVAGNSTATQSGVSIAPTSTVGQVLTFDLENYYASSGGGTLLRSDDGFNGTVNIEIRPSCNVVNNVNQPMTWQYTFKKVPNLDGLTTNYYTSSADQVKYKPANFTFTSPTQTVEATSPTISWEVDLKNNSGMAGLNSWFLLQNSSGKITVTEVRDRTSNAVMSPDANGFYQFGTTNANATKKIRVSATYTNCELDELKVLAGTDCDSYPTSLASFGCPYQQFNLYNDPQPSELQVRLRSYPPSAECDDYVTVEVEMLASKLGAVTDMEVRVAPQPEADIFLQTGSTQFQYPAAAAYQSFTTPALSNGYHAMFAEDLVPSLAATGMPGVTNTAANLFKIKFNLELGETYRPGDQIDIVVFSKKPCGSANSASVFHFDPSANFERKTNIGLDGALDAWSVSWVDIDNDSDPDLFVGTAAPNETNALFRNNGNGTFTKIASGAITTDKTKAYASTWADIDNDGYMDGFVGTDVGKKKLLYKNNGDGTFTKITDESLVDEKGYIRGVSWCDYDNDGWVDLFMADFFKTGFNQIYHNDGDGTFTKITDNAIAKEAGSSVAGIWGDYNNDGLSDLFVCNTNDEPNSLYKNLGGGQFESITTGAIATDGGKSVGASWGDIDSDGDLDLLVINGGAQNPFLYRNLGDGSFSRIMTGDLPNEAGFGNGSSLVDYDNDGDLDAIITRDQNQGSQLYANDGTGFFRRVSSNISLDLGLSMASAWADYDSDGDYDVVIANRNGGELFFYKNLSGQCNAKICLKLVGTHSNRAAIGAKVRVKATVFGQSVWQMRQISAQSGGGIGSQDDIRAIFGLGDATSVDSIVVEWPSGLRQAMSGLAINQCHTITEPVASRVCGSVWLDLDGDCVRDAEEAPLANTRIRVEPQNYYTATDAEGNYEIHLTGGSYTVSALPGEGYSVECPTTNNHKHNITVDGISQSCGHDFGLSSSCIEVDLEVEVLPTALRVGFKNLIAIHWRNRGGSDASNLSLSVNMGANIQVESATLPWTSVEGSTYIWTLPDLQMGKTGTIYAMGFIPSSVPIGQDLELDASITCNEPECNGSNNSYLTAERTIGALDPNDIAVSPEGFIRAGQELTYKIRFQNVGTFLAKKVVVENLLPEGFDLSTLTIGAASHPFRIQVSDEGRRLTWVFDNINLPDSTSNEAMSHGFVIYKIRPKVDLAGGTRLANFADIYFDNLAPLRTNVVTNTIRQRSTAAFADPNHFLIFPNPATDRASIVLPDLEHGYLALVQVFDLNGRLVWQKSNHEEEISQVEIPVETWQAGTYLMKGTTYLGYLLTGKLVVIH